MTKTFQDAYELAVRGHANQTDQGGHPHIHHIDRVLKNARALLDALPPGAIEPTERDEIEITAALHDVAEDKDETGVTYAEIEPFGPNVMRRVRRLDKAFRVGSYQNNIEAMCIEGDIGVIMVKLADNRDNSDPARIAQLPPERRSIADRYERSARALQAAYDEFKAAAWAAYRAK